MKHLIFLGKQKLLSLIAYLLNIPFAVKLKVLVWYYKGGQNIPPEVAAKYLKIIDSKESGEALSQVVKAITALQAVCRVIGINYIGTNTGGFLGDAIHNDFADQETATEINTYLNRKDINRAVWEMMVTYGDLKQHTIDFHWATDESKTHLEIWKDCSDREVRL